MSTRPGRSRATASLVLVLLAALAIVPMSAHEALASARFHVECPFHHHRSDDPIVSPGQPGASHHHAFFGNTSTDAHSTYRSLRAAGTTCGLRADKGAYWIPAVSRDGELVSAVDADFYYRGVTAPLRAIRPFPKGLKIIAGDGHAEGPQSTRVIAWSCTGSSGTGQETIRDCGDAFVKVLIRFPSCWDGVRRDSADHRSHMRYAIRRSDGRRGCPRSHPIPVPELTYSITLPFHDGVGVTLSSGPPYTMHADFINAWNQRVLRRLVERCIHAGIECSSFDA
ncbi:MAG TPA: DUF1996 domain-containing protein [Actinomycetota bacterium]|nr:DUF1996 domain-containing protein [Actinomycetota bacterium]